MSPKTVVRDYRCRACGVVMKGVKDAQGNVKATNRPYTDDVVGTCTCMACVEKAK